MLIKKNKEELQAYLEDTSNLKGNASLLYLPENKNEVCAVIKDCSRKKIPFTISAGKTGTTGGCVPLEGAIISVENLKKVIGIDKELKVVHLEPGVTFQELESQVNKSRLTLRASPTESLACIGGAISTCASGVRGFGYGSMRNYVCEIEMVLATGESIKIKRADFVSKKRFFNFIYEGNNFKFSVPFYNLPKVKSQAGYFTKDNMDLIDLFIGSEGTLGIITSCKLALQEMAFNIFDGLVFFTRESDVFSFVNIIRELKEKGELKPASLEFFDRNALSLLRTEYPFIPEAEAGVYFEQEVESNDNYNYLFEKWVSLIEETQALKDKTIFGDNVREREKIFEIRHKLPQLINEFLRQHKQLKAATDIAVPWKNFIQMYDFYKEIARNSDIDYVNFGHIAESHLHFNFLPKTDQESAKAKEYLKQFYKKAVSLGGTVSAEHGIGKIKKPYLKIMYNESQIKEMVMLKKYFDPQCLLGLDNIFEKELLFKHR
ncbi:MAG: FAD-binding oxidoreductase [Candidatus Omnitrophota bacterium]|nr:FAD-binding oxidoreductase [Candidatus Omnitrophota bacterium]